MRQWMWLAVAGLLSGVISAQATAGDNDSWPQFRGPQGDGHATATGLPVEWSERRNIRWKTTIPGTGWSSPVILGGQIWVTTALDEGRSLHAVCVEQASGKIVHEKEIFRIPAGVNIHAVNSHASPSPVIETGRVYVNFGTSGTACLDTSTGKILWTNTELKLDHEVGAGSSPILYGNLLLLTCDGYDTRYMAALDKQTGKVVWRKPRPGALNKSGTINKAFSTPLVIKSGGRDVAVSPSAQQVVAYDPLTGEVEWLVKYPGFSNVPRPVFGCGLIFVCTGYPKPEVWAIRPDGRGDVTQTHVAWKFTKQAPAKPSPILVDEVLYLVTDMGLVTCLNARTGQNLGHERMGGPYSASPIYADGRLYFCDEKGTTHVVEPSPRLKKIADNQLDGRLMASPAVAGNALYLRTDTSLYRIEK